jgi:hypothetical protein
MIGGVAVAAGTGVLPRPFSDDRPGPAATVSAAVTPERPLVSPSPGASAALGSESPTPGAGTGSPSDSGGSGTEARGSGATNGQPGSGSSHRSGHSGEWWRGTLSSCRDILDGRDLDAGRRQALEDAAGGSGRVKKYCKSILGRGDGSSGKGQDSQGDQGSDQGSGNGDQGGDDGGNHILPGSDGHQDNGGILTPSPSALTPLLPEKTTSSPLPQASTPTPTYSALSLLTGV